MVSYWSHYTWWNGKRADHCHNFCRLTENPFLIKNCTKSFQSSTGCVSVWLASYDFSCLLGREGLEISLTIWLFRNSKACTQLCRALYCETGLTLQSDQSKATSSQVCCTFFLSDSMILECTVLTCCDNVRLLSHDMKITAVNLFSKWVCVV